MLSTGPSCLPGPDFIRCVPHPYPHHRDVHHQSGIDRARGASELLVEPVTPGDLRRHLLPGRHGPRHRLPRRRNRPSPRVSNRYRSARGCGLQHPLAIPPFHYHQRFFHHDLRNQVQIPIQPQGRTRRFQQTSAASIGQNRPCLSRSAAPAASKLPKNPQNAPFWTLPADPAKTPKTAPQNGSGFLSSACA